MIFHGTNNQTVEFRIINYQFPDNNDGDWDGNWLLIYLDVKSDFGNWETTDPSLTTWDMQYLIDWFIILSKNEEPEERHLNFMEPNLSFWFLRSDQNRKTIRIRFALESRPKSALEETKYFVDGEWSNSELKVIADNLILELERFPERKGLTNS